MQLISLKASNGKYIQADPAQDGRILARTDDHSPFIMEDRGENRIRLRDLTHRAKYVEAENTGDRAVFARLDTPNAQALFTLVVRADKQVALLAPDGRHYLSCLPDGSIHANATSIGASEVFELERASTAESRARSVDSDAAPLWDDYTHSRIVEVATGLIIKHHINQPPVRQLSMLLNEKAFKDALLRGLREADYNSDYTGLLYKYHFYHPATGQNYMGFGETAVSMGARHCNKAIELGNDIFRKFRHGQRPTQKEFEDCGFQIGIAAHFITDLVQPMHSSNFANVFADRFPMMNWNDLRHSGLEKMTEDLVVDERYIDDAAPFSYDKFDPAPYGTPDSILHEAAVIANGTFRTLVTSRMPEPGNAWKKEDVKAILDATIKAIGLHSVARFFCFFASQAARVELVKPGTLYRLKGYDGRYATRVDQWIKLEKRENSANQQFFFLSNGDGTHAIASSAARSERLAITQQDFNLGIVALRNPQQVEPRERTFKLSAHGGNRIKIHEFTRDELLSVKTNWPWQNHLVRWSNNEDPTNFWELEEVGPMVAESDVDDASRGAVTESATVEKTSSGTVNVHVTVNVGRF